MILWRLVAASPAGGAHLKTMPFDRKNLPFSLPVIDEAPQVSPDLVSGAGKQENTAHGIIIPAEVRTGEPVAAALTILDEQGRVGRYAPPVWRLSPLGVELAFRDRIVLGGHERLSLTLFVGRQTLNYPEVVPVGWVSEASHEILHVRLAKESPGQARSESRRTPRWPTSTKVAPTGFAINPARLNDTIHFSVDNVSAHGVRLVTSLRNKYLLQGLTLRSTIHIPGQGSVETPLEILHSRVVPHADSEGYLAVGARFQRLNAAILTKLGQYLLQLSHQDGATLWALQSAGMQIHSLSSALTFGRIQNDSDYREVLQLRRDSYRAAGKIPNDTPLEEMGDAFDQRGRIIVARHHGKIVGTVRLLFASSAEELEHTADVQLPPSFPVAADMLEVSRLCVLDGYRGDDLMIGLLQQALLVALQTRRRWILGSTTGKLRPVYEAVGCQFPGVSYRLARLNNMEHFVFLADTLALASGAGVNPAVWSLFIPEVLSQIDFDPVEGQGLGARARATLYKALHPASKFFLAQRRARWRLR